MLAAACLLAVACHRLPKNFASLSTNRKIEVYSQYLVRGGLPNRQARALIASDCPRAAELLSVELAEPHHKLDVRETLVILNMMQADGCDLQRTPADPALQAFLRTAAPGSADRAIAENTLSAMRAGYHARHASTPQ